MNEYTGQSYVRYGPLRDDGVGTSMHAELHPNNITRGSKPSVRPDFWPMAIRKPAAEPPAADPPAAESPAVEPLAASGRV